MKPSARLHRFNLCGRMTHWTRRKTSCHRFYIGWRPHLFQKSGRGNVIGIRKRLDREVALILS